LKLTLKAVIIGNCSNRRSEKLTQGLDWELRSKDSGSTGKIEAIYAITIYKADYITESNSEKLESILKIASSHVADALSTI